MMSLQRGCVEDQPQQCSNRNCASKFRRPPGSQRCCDWLSAQSRSGGFFFRHSRRKASQIH